jgi:hypothetical protein
MAQRYFAYHVDAHGVARASYELHGIEDATAVSHARYFLRFHSSLEIWQGARSVARLSREELEQRRDH